MERPEGWLEWRTDRPAMPSPPVLWRWFREGRGMPPMELDAPSGRYLSFAEREDTSLLRVGECGVREIARQLARSASTMSRELLRSFATRSRKHGYRASVAHWKAVGATRPEGEQARRERAAARLSPRPALRGGDRGGRYGARCASMRSARVAARHGPEPVAHGRSPRAGSSWTDHGGSRRRASPRPASGSGRWSSASPPATRDGAPLTSRNGLGSETKGAERADAQP